MERVTWMQKYLVKVQDLLHQFREWKDIQIPREENTETDALTNLGSVAGIANSEDAIVVNLFHSAVDQTKCEVNFNSLTCDWRNEFINYL